LNLPSRRILAATRNKDKLREIRQILADTDWKILELDDFPSYPEPPEDGDTLVDNALQKAREGFTRTGVLSLADDSGLEVDYLNGGPGIHSARYAGENASYDDNVNLLLQELVGVSDSQRKARFRCVMALVGDQFERTWEGVVEGIILTERRGKSGFGYDPVFWSPELDQTFAEASPDDKNRVSHRGKALRELSNILRELS